MRCAGREFAEHGEANYGRRTTAGSAPAGNWTRWRHSCSGLRPCAGC